MTLPTVRASQREFDHAGIATTPPAAHALDVAAVARTYLESGYTLVVGAGVVHASDDTLMKQAIDSDRLIGPRTSACCKTRASAEPS